MAAERGQSASTEGATKAPAANARLADTSSPKTALHGVNLSGWLVLESWVTPSLFSATGAFDERGLIESVGHRRYLELVRHHRDFFMTEQDFVRIAARGLDAVRLPVPWYVFGQDGPLHTRFAGCMDYVDQAFVWAERAGLKVLLDVSIVSGGSFAKGAMSNANETYRDALLGVVGGLVRRYSKQKAFLGIEPIDEPIVQSRRGLSVTEGVPPHRLRNFYRDAYDVVRTAGGDGPIVVLSDAGAPASWRKFMAQDRYHNVWLDSHLYHHSDPVDATGPDGVRRLVRASSRSLEQASRSDMPVMVGEWSAALPMTDSAMTPEGRNALERVYASGQIAAFSHAPAWFFQTWKTEGRLSSWDARIALASFERGMLD
jgi:glucan 1,3-beta-glucosidase